MTWQKKVKQLMQNQSINQKQLSQRSGITEASVSRYLKGERTARIDIIVNFAKALNEKNKLIALILGSGE